VRLLKWPDSVQLQLWEWGPLHDRFVAAPFLAVPGIGGSPHIDPQPKPVSWTCPDPLPQQALAEAAAAAEVQGLVSLTAPRGGRRGGGSGDGVASPAALAPEAGAGQGVALATIFPAGAVFVRSGWVSEGGLASVLPGVFGAATAKRLAEDAAAGDAACLDQYDGADGAATLALVQPFDTASAPARGFGASGAASGGAWVTYNNPLSADGGGGGRGGALRDTGGTFASWGAKASMLRLNPLADQAGGAWDIEVAPALAPPQPPLNAEAALRRAIVGGCTVRGRGRLR
jgi:hypothetical protein